MTGPHRSACGRREIGATKRPNAAQMLCELKCTRADESAEGQPLTVSSKIIPHGAHAYSTSPSYRSTHPAGVRNFGEKIEAIVHLDLNGELVLLIGTHVGVAHEVQHVVVLANARWCHEVQSRLQVKLS